MGNEHPDMHGNWADMPILCHRCGREVQENKVFGSDFIPDEVFCSFDCVEDWEESQSQKEENMPTEKYDSRPDTWRHIEQVRLRINRCINDLLLRGHFHDQSKLVSPEVEAFDENTPKLAGLTYGSDEYKACLAAMKPAIDHHQKANRHHPEYHADGIRGMNLLDLVEMLCDWKAATLRHNDGDIRKSIEINQKRFGYSEELKQIFLNSLQLID